MEQVADVWSFSGRRVAIVHEWVAGRLGSEKVYEALAAMLPEADLYALSYEPDAALDLQGRTVRTTILNTLLGRKWRGMVLPLMPWAWNRFREETYDVVVTSSHAFSRWFRPARKAEHFSYVHAPLRYVWTPEIDSRGRSAHARAAAPLLRRLDLKSNQWTDHFAGNSTEVASRIAKFYGRRAAVIPPPVRVAPHAVDDSIRRIGLLAVGRWVDYKRFDLAIAAAAIAREPLTVAGRGPLGPQIRRLARQSGTRVRVVESPSDELLAELYATHRALLFPTREDFGLIPVEAAAFGLPVIAYAGGGALDTVIDGVTGVLVQTPTPAAFAHAIEQSRGIAWSPQRLRSHASHFSVDSFRRRTAIWFRSPAEALERSERTPLW